MPIPLLSRTPLFRSRCCHLVALSWRGVPSHGALSARIVWLLGALVLFLFASGTAAGAPGGATLRVAVATLEGPTKLARQARSVVLRALVDDHSLIPLRKLEEARTNPTSTSGGDDAASWAALAQAIDADAIVTGGFTGKGKNRQLELVMHAGWDGHEVARRTVPFPRRSLSRDEQQAIAAATRELASELARASAGRGPSSPTDAAATTDRSAQDRNPSETIGPGTSGESLPSGTADSSSHQPLWRQIHGRASLGWSFMNRDLRFAVAEGIPDALQPFRYERGLASGVAFGVEAFPLEGLDTLRGHLRPIGVRFGFDRTIGLRSELQGGMGQDFGTVQQHIGIAAVYRYTRPIAGRELEVRGGIGYDRLSHTIDIDNPAVTLPDVVYGSLALSGGARMTALPWLVPYVELGLLLGLGAGEIEAMDQYGDSSVFGLDLDIGLDTRPSRALPVPDAVRVRVGLRYVRMHLGFSGAGMLSDLDGDGQADVDGASDAYLGGYLVAGYVF